jgi:hypothetical protein
MWLSSFHPRHGLDDQELGRCDKCGSSLIEEIVPASRTYAGRKGGTTRFSSDGSPVMWKVVRCPKRGFWTKLFKSETGHIYHEEYPGKTETSFSEQK